MDARAEQTWWHGRDDADSAVMLDLTCCCRTNSKALNATAPSLSTSKQLAHCRALPTFQHAAAQHACKHGGGCCEHSPVGPQAGPAGHYDVQVAEQLLAQHLGQHARLLDAGNPAGPGLSVWRAGRAVLLKLRQLGCPAGAAGVSGHCQPGVVLSAAVWSGCRQTSTLCDTHSCCVASQGSAAWQPPTTLPLVQDHQEDHAKAGMAFRCSGRLATWACACWPEAPAAAACRGAGTLRAGGAAGRSCRRTAGRQVMTCVWSTRLILSSTLAGFQCRPAGRAQVAASRAPHQPMLHDLCARWAADPQAGNCASPTGDAYFTVK